MTTEELLRPRWKVIADFPCNVGHDVGEIVSESIYKSEPDCYFIDIDLDGKVFGICPDDYPHLFKRLKWWEERDESELPNYIKIQHNIPIPTYQRLNGIYKIKEYVTWGIKVEGLEGIIYFSKYTVPATEEEYLNQ